MRYPIVLFDLDHTLVDSDTSFRLAFEHVMAPVRLSDPVLDYPVFNRINAALWRAVEAGAMTPPKVNLLRFEQLTDELRLDVDPHRLAASYATSLGQFGELYPGARAVLDALDPTVTMALVTNGLSSVQRARVERLELAKYFDHIVVSAEVGVSKPAPAIFDVVFDALANPDPASVLMIGDSLTSDIKGGVDYGIDTCWYNPSSAIVATGVTPTHTITRLGEIPTIVGVA